MSVITADAAVTKTLPDVHVPNVADGAFFYLPEIVNPFNTEIRKVVVPQYVASRGYLKVPAWTTATYDAISLPSVDDEGALSFVSRPVTVKAVELDVANVVAAHNLVNGEPSMHFTADDAVNFWQDVFAKSTFGFSVPLGNYSFPAQSRGRSGRSFVVMEESVFYTDIVTSDRDPRFRATSAITVSANGRHLTIAAGITAIKALKAPTITIFPADKRQAGSAA